MRNDKDYAALAEHYITWCGYAALAAIGSITPRHRCICLIQLSIGH